MHHNKMKPIKVLPYLGLDLQKVEPGKSVGGRNRENFLLPGQTFYRRERTREVPISRDIDQY